MEFKNTPIENLWIFCKHFTTWTAFIVSLFFLWGGIVGLVNKEFGAGFLFIAFSIALMMFEKNLAQTLREEEFSRKQRLDKEQENS